MSMMLGTALVRIQPSMAGFGAALTAGLSTQSAALMRGGAAASILISAPIIAGVAASVSAAVNFETAFAGVRKTVNATDAEFKILEQGIRNMAKEMPFAREEIAGVVEAAGRFGVANKDLLTFSEIALQLGVSTGMGAAQAAESLTRLSNIINLPADQFRQLSSAVVALGNDFPTTEREILNMSLRLAGAGELIGLTASDITGFAAGLTSLGIKAEAGGTAFSRVFKNINDAALTGGDKLKNYLDIMGLTKEQFEASWKDNPSEAILAFVGGIDKLNKSGANTPAILKNMGLGDVRIQDALLRSASGYDTLSSAIDTSHKAFEQGTALQQEYDKRADTTASKWQIIKNKMSDVGVTIGQALIPVLLQLMIAMEPVINFIAMMAEAFSSLPVPMQQVILGIVAMIAIAGPLIVIFIRLKGAFDAMKLALMTNPWMALVLALIIAAYLIYTHWETIKETVANAWNWITEKSFLFGQALRAMWDTYIWPVLSPFVHFFETIGGIASGAWDWVVRTTILAKDAIVKALKEMVKWLDKAMGPLDEIVGGVFNVVGGLLGFDEGGTVPGPRGAPRVILAHGGETVLPTHKRPMSNTDDFALPAAPASTATQPGMVVQGPLLQITGPITIREDQDIVKLSRALGREVETAAKARGRVGTVRAPTTGGE